MLIEIHTRKKSFNVCISYAGLLLLIQKNVFFHTTILLLKITVHHKDINGLIIVFRLYTQPSRFNSLGYPNLFNYMSRQSNGKTKIRQNGNAFGYLNGGKTIFNKKGVPLLSPFGNTSKPLPVCIYGGNASIFCLSTSIIISISKQQKFSLICIYFRMKIKRTKVA